MDKNTRVFIFFWLVSLLLLVLVTVNNLVITEPQELPAKITSSSYPRITLSQIKKAGFSLKEARYYKKLPDGRVECQLDPWKCTLAENERGICRVKVNIGGKLNTLVYGQVSAAHIDPIEKKPLFHFLPSTGAFSIATAGCNFGCTFCQNWELSQANPEDISHEYMPPEKVVELALKYDCRSIAYTYNEPIIFYEYMLDTAKLAREKGVKNLLITAGFINPEPLRELCRYIDAANVDLKGFTEKYYKEVIFGDLKTVLQTLKIMKEEGVWLEITTLIVPTLNDDPEEIKQMCLWIKENLGPDVPLHFSRFHPMYKLKNLPPTPAATLVTARDIACQAGLKYVYIGNIPGHEGEHTYCPHCGKIIVKRVGFTITENNIVTGHCRFCNEKIPGLWQ